MIQMLSSYSKMRWTFLTPTHSVFSQPNLLSSFRSNSISTRTIEIHQIQIHSIK